MKIQNFPLFIGGFLSLIASLLHVAIIFGGPDWYRFFGAGEEMAKMAARGDIRAALITFGIASVLFIWALFGFAGAGIMPHLPFMRVCLVGISAVYLIRGLLPFLILPFFAHLSDTFLIVSSIVCAIFGIFYAIGTWQMWPRLAQN